MNKNKPILYLDIDGVVFCYPREGSRGFKGHVEVTPHLVPFLKRVHDLGFELRLLTYNPDGGRALLDMVRHSGFCGLRDWDLNGVPSCCFDKGFYNGLSQRMFDRSKACYVDLSRDFLWVEDGISYREAKMLLLSGRQDCYRHVDSRAYGALWRAVPWIEGHPIARGERREYPTAGQLDRPMDEPLTPARAAAIPRGCDIKRILQKGRGTRDEEQAR